jgi:hypothetical protein
MKIREHMRGLTWLALWLLACYGMRVWTATPPSRHLARVERA